ncbi:MAG: CpaF family protein [Clostridia bacterium]|nr:CpaF family protein [Clostridia bacterium]
MYEKIREDLYRFNSLADLSDDELIKVINSIALRYCKNKKFSVSERDAIVRKVFCSVRGLGVLDELLADDDISEIMVNSYDELFIEKHGRVEKSEVSFDNEKELMDVIQRIVGRSGREVNTANPIVDTRLPGGERVNVVLPPISIRGPVMTVRKFPKKRITIEELIDNGTLTDDAAQFLKRMVEEKCNIFISGGTSSGKTTFLNVLSDFIPENERIITIEDSAELQLRGIKNLIRMEVRNANTTGNGEVGMKELIRTSLRMRPDRIIVGEVRGEEALDMLNAMNTGHDGSLSTGHANSSYDMLYRLESMILQSGISFPLRAVRQHIFSSIDIIVHLARTSDGKRRVVEISEIEAIKDDNFLLNTLYYHTGGVLVETGQRMKRKKK